MFFFSVQTQLQNSTKTPQLHQQIRHPSFIAADPASPPPSLPQPRCPPDLHCRLKIPATFSSQLRRNHNHNNSKQIPPPHSSIRFPLQQPSSPSSAIPLQQQQINLTDLPTTPTLPFSLSSISNKFAAPTPTLSNSRRRPRLAPQSPCRTPPSSPSRHLCQLQNKD